MDLRIVDVAGATLALCFGAFAACSHCPSALCGDGYAGVRHCVWLLSELRL